MSASPSPAESLRPILYGLCASAAACLAMAVWSIAASTAAVSAESARGCSLDGVAWRSKAVLIADIGSGQAARGIVAGETTQRILACSGWWVQVETLRGDRGRHRPLCSNQTETCG